MDAQRRPDNKAAIRIVFMESLPTTTKECLEIIFAQRNEVNRDCEPKLCNEYLQLYQKSLWPIKKTVSVEAPASVGPCNVVHLHVKQSYSYAALTLTARVVSI
jgi:hypothetical protein